MHSTEWGRKTHHEPAPKTGLRAQLTRGFHLTFGSLRVLATEPRLMALPFLALVFTGFVWLIVVLSVLALGLPPVSPSSGFLYQEIFVAYLVTGLVFLLLFAVGLVPFVWGIVGEPGSLAWPVAAVLYWLILSALWSVVHGILVTTLYHYAMDSEASFGFSWQALNHPWIR